MSTFPFHLCQSISEAKSALEAWGSFAIAAGPTQVAVALAAPPGLSDFLLADELQAQFGESVFYQDSRSPQRFVIGLGAAVRLRVDGLAPFEELVEALTQQHIEAQPSLVPYLRFFGGGAFDPRRPHEENCWREFGAASLILPQISYLQVEDEAALILVVSRENSAPTLEHAAQIVNHSVAQFVDSEATEESEGTSEIRVISRVDSADEPTWKALFDQAQLRMSEGRIEKVVTARRVTVELSKAPRFSAVIQHLRSHSHDCTIFALRLGKRVFLGATPETLVRKEGDSIRTEALAGTRARRGTEDGDQAGATLLAGRELLASAKDCREHAFVVEAIRQSLAPFCHAISVPEQPSVRALTRMVHLWTPIECQLSTPRHVLELVNCLHPTPAVGGVPQSEALDFIFAEEHVERGWYAAPFGWCTAAGDGHFVVALRSALIAHNKVHLYAGAGIVAGSVAEAEYEETELKMGSILGALGLAS